MYCIANPFHRIIENNVESIFKPSSEKISRRTHAINACGSLGKIKIQKNPAIKDWIAENKKMVGGVLIVRKTSLKLKMVAS